MDELQDQIVSLKKVKSAASLQKNLTEKMKDISNRVADHHRHRRQPGEADAGQGPLQDQLAEMTPPDASPMSQ
jgi:hypothetical protein